MLRNDDHANSVLHIHLHLPTNTHIHTNKHTFVVSIKFCFLDFGDEEESENFNVKHKSHEETDFSLKMSIKYPWEILITCTNDYDDECMKDLKNWFISLKE